MELQLEAGKMKNHRFLDRFLLKVTKKNVLPFLGPSGDYILFLGFLINKSK